jgi:hypothetical protein
MDDARGTQLHKKWIHRSAMVADNHTTLIVARWQLTPYFHSPKYPRE